jgi:TonB-dependent SusC/RagA subfamily outer membrane receptor
METYLIYIGKVAVATSAFYIAYLLLFQNRKQFVFNRIYLPVSLAVSFIIPLITFTTVKYFNAETSVDPNSFAWLPEPEETQALGFVWEWYHLLTGLYIAGVAGFLLHLLLGHWKALTIVGSSRTEEIFGAKVCVTRKEVHPFSFFNRIVVSEKTLSHPNLDMIVSHENIHVGENHTLDILLTEILFLFQWFNPFAWLIRDAVKNNLEYKTDHQIAQHFHPQTYQLAMVSLADKEGVAPFLTALNGSQLKNRIIMMKKKTENKFAVVKQLAVLPLLAILVMSLSNRETKTEIVQNETVTVIAVTQNDKTVKGKITDEKGLPVSSVSVILKGKTTGTISDPNGNYEIKLASGPETLIFSMPGYERVESTVNPEKQKELNVKLKVDKNAKPGELKVVANGNNPTAVPGSLTIRNADGTISKPLFIVDGKETESIETLDPATIESISVLKEKSATDLYGEKGINGVVLITSKEAAKTAQNKFFGNPLVIVDGKEFHGEINDIPVENVASINVLKGESAIVKYGEKGNDGVIEVATKSGNDAISSTLQLRRFIAERIKYPVKAQENGEQATVRLYVKMGKTCEVVAKPNGEVPNLDEVVVVAYSKGTVTAPGKKENYQALENEVIRVIGLLPEVNIPEFKGKTVEFTVNFVLQ